ncbi:protein SULFUR DEFICIENCY-INDUCED 1-like [Rhododendron vialii]|uniref:protein SULFUR DEFICIENCY-INDUCED 1-like n=1 Tax=Rhododendron vialii TaxID=182163 RepID=UPI0026602767|nr:protein SULFUR DEFICIENCY-INDUCED 1-like [Rhododendron vialii]
MEWSSSEKSWGKKEKEEPYHVIHKVPCGDGPYVKAKHAQLVQKDLEGAIVWFWKAINAGDRVDSALKDMAVVMKQMDRTEEAIEAIKSFRGRCSKQSQESLDNVLIDLYKKCGKADEQIVLIKQKLRLIYQGEAFNGKPTKTARSHGKKFQVSVRQETSKLLGNLGWAYMQKTNYIAAEVVYKKAQMIDPDTTKACNLAVCLIKQARDDEAHLVLEEVLRGRLPGSCNTKSRARAQELLLDLKPRQPPPPPPLSSEVMGRNLDPSSSEVMGLNLDQDFVDGLERLMHAWAPSRSKRLPIFEEISSFRDQLAC